MKSAEMIIERINKDIFSFFDMNAIQEILIELKDIRIIDKIKKVLYMNSYFSLMKSRLETADSTINTDIVIK